MSVILFPTQYYMMNSVNISWEEKESAACMDKSAGAKKRTALNPASRTHPPDRSRSHKIYRMHTEEKAGLLTKLLHSSGYSCLPSGDLLSACASSGLPDTEDSAHHIFPGPLPSRPNMALYIGGFLITAFNISYEIRRRRGHLIGFRGGGNQRKIRLFRSENLHRAMP